MFFAHVARIVSILVLALGIMLVLIGFSIAFDWMGVQHDVAMSRYLPAFKTTGEAINKGCLYILIAVALGTLSEIVFCLHRGRD